MKMTFQEIRIIATVPCIANQLRDVNTICRRSWYIAAHVWKIYDFKIEVVPLIINFSTELTTVATDAYFHCPISVAFRKYLRFVWDNTVFQLRALPFELAIIFQIVSAHLHTLSIHIHSYLDDSLVQELNPDILLSHIQTVIDLLLEIGFLFSWKKSEIIPSQYFVFSTDLCVSSRGEMFGSSSVYSNLFGQDLSHCSSIFTTARSSQLSSL